MDRETRAHVRPQLEVSAFSLLHAARGSTVQADAALANAAASAAARLSGFLGTKAHAGSSVMRHGAQRT